MKVERKKEDKKGKKKKKKRKEKEEKKKFCFSRQKTLHIYNEVVDTNAMASTYFHLRCLALLLFIFLLTFFSVLFFSKKKKKGKMEDDDDIVDLTRNNEEHVHAAIEKHAAVHKKPSTEKQIFTLAFDSKEKYTLTHICNRVQVLNRTRHPKPGEPPVEVRVKGFEGMKTGDISIRQEHERGRFELKRENDTIANLSQKYHHFKSQLEPLAALGKSLDVVGLIFMFRPHLLTERMKLTMMSITTKYTIRARKAGTGIFMVEKMDPLMEHLAEFLYRVCENLARVDCDIVPEAHKLEGINLGENRRKAVTAVDHLELSLRNISGVGNVAAFELAKDYKSISNMSKRIASEGISFVKPYTAQRLGRKTALGVSVGQKILAAFDDAYLPPNEKGKRKASTSHYSSAPSSSKSRATVSAEKFKGAMANFKLVQEDEESEGEEEDEEVD